MGVDGVEEKSSSILLGSIKQHLPEPAHFGHSLIEFHLVVSLLSQACSPLLVKFNEYSRLGKETLTTAQNIAYISHTLFR